jgi:ABC transport system ATP-binding/permease protein
VPPLLLLQDIVLTFGAAPLLSGAGLAVAAGDRICLVGRNGSGKSTLLGIAAGLVQADAGERFAQPGTTIQYLPQEPDLAGFATTLAYVEAGFDAIAADGHHQALYLLKELGLCGNEDPASLSGGEARRAALARALAPSPDILLLDEPTNHLDLPGIEWLERELAELRSGIVLISHDRRLLERFSHRTVWLDRGITRVLEQGFASFESWRDTVLEQQENEQHKLGRKIAIEEDWLRYGVTARRTRNQRRLAELHALRHKRREYRGTAGTARLDAAQADLSGRLVAAAEGVSKAFGDHILVRNFSIRVMRGDRLGIVGPNGAGKTTLLKLLTGALAPDNGAIRLGTNLAPGTLDQRRESLDPKWTLAQAMTGGSGDTVTVGDESSYHCAARCRTHFRRAPRQTDNASSGACIAARRTPCRNNRPVGREQRRRAAPAFSPSPPAHHNKQRRSLETRCSSTRNLSTSGHRNSGVYSPASRPGSTSHSIRAAAALRWLSTGWRPGTYRTTPLLEKPGWITLIATG